MKKFKRVKLNLRTYGCTINYVRNPKWFVFTHESQKTDVIMYIHSLGGKRMFLKLHIQFLRLAILMAM